MTRRHNSCRPLAGLSHQPSKQQGELSHPLSFICCVSWLKEERWRYKFFPTQVLLASCPPPGPQIAFATLNCIWQCDKRHPSQGGSPFPALVLVPDWVVSSQDVLEEKDITLLAEPVLCKGWGFFLGLPCFPTVHHCVERCLVKAPS